MSPLVEECLWERSDKCLVYDGQQRLQTLYSCLKYTLNDKVLAYNLLYNNRDEDAKEQYGFEFIDRNSDRPGYVKLPALFSKTDDEKVTFRRQLRSLVEMTDDEEVLFESRFDRLWSVFAEIDTKSFAYFPIGSMWSKDRVNDLFQRLNIGGVPIS